MRSRHRVREANGDDVEAVNVIYNHYVRTSHATFDLEPVDLAWQRRWLADHLGRAHRVVVAEEAGKVVGYASSSPYRSRAAYADTVETSVYVASDSLGRGIGGTLYAALFHVLSSAGVHRAVAGIALPNSASIALHRRFGFRRVGRFTEQGRKFGRYWDVDWWEKPIARSETATSTSDRTA